MAKNDLADALGFTWDRSALPRNIAGNDVRRAVWRFGKMLPGYVWDAAVLEGNPFTYPEVQTLLEGITVGGRKLSDERQILNLSESANELIHLVQSGQFLIDKSTSDVLNDLIASGESHGIDAISVPAARKQEFNTEMIEFYWQQDGTRMFRFLASCWEDAQ
jgi:hypothetical protein